MTMKAAMTSSSSYVSSGDHTHRMDSFRLGSCQKLCHQKLCQKLSSVAIGHVLWHSLLKFFSKMCLKAGTVVRLQGLVTLGLVTLAMTLMTVTTLFIPQAYGDIKTAKKLFVKKRFQAAAPEYFKSYNFPKSGQEKTEATYGLARSLERSGLPYSASKYYSLVFLKGVNHPQFKNATTALGRIDSRVGLGRAHAIQLFSRKISPSNISGAARGFYFYYQGLEAFSKKAWQKASRSFSRINSSSTYYHKAQFHLGVISALRNNLARAIKYFQTAQAGSDTLAVQASLNMARSYYEKRNFRKAFQHYANVQRDNEYWLDTIFESAWAFFILKKHNNVLGNIHTIHSPFYSNRFYPESYVLQAITFLRLCRYNQVKQSQRIFRSTYKPLNVSLKRVIGEFNSQPVEFFNLIKTYKDGSLNRYEKAWPIIDYLARTNVFKAAYETVRRSDQELSKLGNTPTAWRNVGLEDELADFLRKKKEAAMHTGGVNLLKIARESLSYLRDLSSQTDFIQLEMNLGKIDKLREKLKIVASREQERTNFIGGLQELKIGQKLEYWPFQGEYWEDELGGYVFNVDSKCSQNNTPGDS
ncbi:MAG: hypothetical protein OXC44_07605 [Proteobacteria bacterium]|nr:hypothetical protein [Pseudomonadota bacterium]